MKKTQLLLLLLMAFSAHSQSFFIKAGKNYTQFNYRNSQNEIIDLHPDVGNSYELGYVFSNHYSKPFQYELSLKLDEFNAYTEAPISAVTYNIHYLGVYNSLYVPIIDGDRNNKPFTLNIKGGFGLYKSITGKEMILNKIYDLQSFPEFKNVFGVASIGLHSKFVVSDYIDLSLGYDHCMSFFNTGNVNNESLAFTSNQFTIGINFPIN
jgi:hypothetical protein